MKIKSYTVTRKLLVELLAIVTSMNDEGAMAAVVEMLTNHPEQERFLLMPYFPIERYKLVPEAPAGRRVVTDENLNAFESFINTLGDEGEHE